MATKKKTPTKRTRKPKPEWWETAKFYVTYDEGWSDNYSGSTTHEVFCKDVAEVMKETNGRKNVEVYKVNLEKVDWQKKMEESFSG